MRKYWRPGLRVWWRCEGEVQLGQDPPTIVFGLSKQEHVLLDALAQADPQLDCWGVALRLGWRRDRYTAFIERLPAHAFVDFPTAAASSVQQYWSVVQTTGAAHSTARFESEILVDGLGPIGLQIADGICRAGIDTVYLSDTHPVLPHEVLPGGFLTDDVGQERAKAALHRLRPRHPMAHLHTEAHPAYSPVYSHPIAAGGTDSSGPSGLGTQAPTTNASQPHSVGGESQNVRPSSTSRPPIAGAPKLGVYAPGLRQAHNPSGSRPPGVNLAIVTGSGALPAHRIRPYEAAGTPVLPVVMRELDIMIGPLLNSGGPCLRCLHLTLTDDDPRWPALATQMATETNPGIDPIVADAAAAIAAHQIIAFADQRPTAVMGASLHVDGIHPIPRVQRWHPHRNCGCRLEHLAG